MRGERMSQVLAPGGREGKEVGLSNSKASVWSVDLVQSEVGIYISYDP